MSKCKARQYSDQMSCHECGLVWDMNDPEPPKCKTPGQEPADADLAKIEATMANLKSFIATTADKIKL